MKKNKVENKNPENKKSLLKTIRKDISDWRKNNISDVLKYNPNSEEYVNYYYYTKEEREEISKNPEFLDENNFRLQIGKMQKDGGTIYNEITLGLGIEYMINHTKKGHQSIIQIWSDVGECLQPGAEDGVLSADKEKERLENFIKEKFGDRGNAIKVEIGSKKYKEEFEEIKKGKEGIIPKEEPNLERMVPFTSPLQIIRYLAYHANKDKNLMFLFYKTKPGKYIGEDVKNNKKPGDSDADFYGIVEVGLRLFEVLNGVYIQGGLGRQRVYDKIISLIVNGKDIIKGEKDFDSDYELRLNDYPALKKLHQALKPKKAVTEKEERGEIEEENNGPDKEFDKLILGDGITIDGKTYKLEYRINEYRENNQFCWIEDGKTTVSVKAKTKSLPDNSDGNTIRRKYCELRKKYIESNCKKQYRNKEQYTNAKFNQLYINLDRKGVEEIEEKLNSKSKLESKIKSKLRNWGYGSLIAAVFAGVGWNLGGNEVRKYFNNKQMLEQLERNERKTKMKSDYCENVQFPRVSRLEARASTTYFEQQADVLVAKYNISKQNHETNYDDKDVIIDNDIVDMYREAFYRERNKKNMIRNILMKAEIEDLNWENLTEKEENLLDGYLTAENFINEYSDQIIDLYDIPRQPPYEHFKKYQDEYQIIDNTLKYGDKIDISKYKTKEISTESELLYFIENDGLYRLKIVEVYLDNGKTINVIVAKGNQHFFSKSTNGGDYTLKNGYLCMKDIQKYIPVWRNPVPDYGN